MSDQTAGFLAPQVDLKATRRCVCEFSSGGVWVKSCTFHANIIDARPSPQAAEQEPAAWVEVVDTHEGPYHFHGLKLLPRGRHNLYSPSPQAASVSVPREPTEAMLATASKVARIAAATKQIAAHYHEPMHCSTIRECADLLLDTLHDLEAAADAANYYEQMYLQRPADNAPQAASVSVPREQLTYRVFKDGNMWCAVGADFINLQESDAAFGESPLTALGELIVLEGAKNVPAN